MNNSKKLHNIKTLDEFERGYWYAIDLKQFAKEIGVANGNKLRKDQLEAVIKSYIQTGYIPDEYAKASTKKAGTKTGAKKSKGDRLALNTVIQHYISNKETKAFIVAEAHKRCPELPKKSGVWYWINRWREAQLDKQQPITYEDLVKQFVALSTQKGRLPQIPSARFNNFITDFLAANAGNRDEAKAAWQQLKALDIPKTYAAWAKYHK